MQPGMLTAVVLKLPKADAKSC